jgi:hypothetical protein
LSFWACSKDFKITIPHPSPRPNPVPRLSKENDLPSFENSLNVLSHGTFIMSFSRKNAYLDFAMVTQNSGNIFRWHPPTIANSDSPCCKLLHASWTATRLDEQAVSIVRLGPCKSKKWEILFDCIAGAQPI